MVRRSITAKSVIGNDPIAIKECKYTAERSQIEREMRWKRAEWHKRIKSLNHSNIFPTIWFLTFADLVQNTVTKNRSSYPVEILHQLNDWLKHPKTGLDSFQIVS